MAAENPHRRNPHNVQASDGDSGAWSVSPYLLALAGALAYGLLVFISLHFIPWMWDREYELLRRFVLVGFAVLAAILAGYAHRHKGWRFWLALSLVAGVYSTTTWMFIQRLTDLGPRGFQDIAGLQLGAGYFFIDWFTRQGNK
jgi:hypothetical protein